MSAAVKSDPPRPKCGGDAFRRGADEAAHHGRLAGLCERKQVLAQPFGDQVVLRDRFRVLRVGDDAVAGIDVCCADAACDKRGGNHGAGKALAVGGDDVCSTRRDFADGCEAAQQLIQRVEVLVDERGHRRELCRGNQLARGLMMARAESDAGRKARKSCRLVPAAAAAFSNWSVTRAIALTMTTGCRPRAIRPATMSAVRRMATASSTEVPPNFMTTSFMPRRPPQLRDEERARR